MADLCFLIPILAARRPTVGEDQTVRKTKLVLSKRDCCIPSQSCGTANTVVAIKSVRKLGQGRCAQLYAYYDASPWAERSEAVNIGLLAPLTALGAPSRARTKQDRTRTWKLKENLLIAVTVSGSPQ